MVYNVYTVFEFDKKLLYMKLKEIEVISAIETFNDCYNFKERICVELCGRKFAKIRVDKNI